MRILIVDPGFKYSTLAVAESYADAFERSGYEVVEYDMQRSLQMARRGLSGNKEISHEEITEFASGAILNQVIQDKIDLVIGVHGYFLNASIVNSLQSLGVKTALILTDDPMQVDISTEWSRHYQYVFTNERNTASRHKNCHYLPVAVNELIFNQQTVDPQYVSTILIGGSMYRERFEFIESNRRLCDLLVKHNTFIVGSRKRDFEKDLRLNGLFKENIISYETMSKYVAGTWISIDIPKDEFKCGMFGEVNKENVRATCLSPRVFETFASGRMCLTSAYRSEIRKLFPGFNIPTWDDSEDLCNLIEQFIEQPDEIQMKSIEEYTLKNHTYMNRVKEIERVMDINPKMKYTNKRSPKLTKEESRAQMVEILTPAWEKNFEELKPLYSSRSIVNILTDKNFECQKAIHIISNGSSLKSLDVGYNGIRLFLNGASEFQDSGNKSTMLKDYILVIHPKDDVYERCFANKPCNCDLICSTLANPKVVKHFLDNDRNVYFFNTGCEGIKEQVFNFTKFPVLGSGFTVGFSALTVAKLLGFKEVKIHGLDFCYLNGEKYRNQKLNYTQMREEETLIVPDLNGHPVITSQIMVSSKNSCLEFMKSNPDIKFKVYGEGLLYSKDIPNLENVDAN